jgi:hypothetical protein
LSIKKYARVTSDQAATLMTLKPNGEQNATKLRNDCIAVRRGELRLHEQELEYQTDESSEKTTFPYCCCCIWTTIKEVVSCRGGGGGRI